MYFISCFLQSINQLCFIILVSLLIRKISLDLQNAIFVKDCLKIMIYCLFQGLKLFQLSKNLGIQNCLNLDIHFLHQKFHLQYQNFVSIFVFFNFDYILLAKIILSLLKHLQTENALLVEVFQLDQSEDLLMLSFSLLEEVSYQSIY